MTARAERRALPASLSFIVKIAIPLPASKISLPAISLLTCARMIRLILFDIDGTLVRTGHAGTQAFAKTFASEFDLHHGSERMKFAGRTDVSLVREFFQINGLEGSPEHFDRFFGQYTFWLDHILADSNGHACAGVFDLIRDLEALPQPPVLGLLTGNIQLGAEIKLRHYGLWERFVMGGFADGHEDRNYIAAAALERGRRVLGPDLQPQEIIVIGDTPFDVRCGKFIGAKTLAVATGGATLHELKACDPDWAVSDLTKITAREICPR